MQQRQLFVRRQLLPAHSSVHRLPPGFSDLRPDAGNILKSARRRQYLKQDVVAHDAGIAHASLSRIESCRVRPKLENVQALLDVLGLQWDDVALRDDGFRDAADAPSSIRKDRMFEAGRSILEARRARGKSLRGLAKECGLSAAQLSRIERGISGGSRVFRDHPGYSDLPRDERPLVIADPILAALVHGTEDRK